MSQSKHSYGAESPKSTANSSRHRETETKTKPKPACHHGERDDCEWRTPLYSPALAEVYPPCTREECFGSQTREPAVGEQVVISRNYPTAHHRLCDKTTEPPEPTESHPVGQYQDVVREVDEAIDTLDDFEEGDGVVWQTPQIPLEVVEVDADGDDEIHLLGPAGGEYALTEAEKDAGAYAVVPGYGCIPKLSRIAPTESQSRWPELERR